MKMVDEIFRKLDCHFDDKGHLDSFDSPSMFISGGQFQIVSGIKAHRKALETYFKCSPEVYQHIKDYKINRLIKFLHRIIKQTNSKGE